jgi:hypothetical protein
MGLIALPAIPPALVALGEAIAFVGSAALAAWGVHETAQVISSEMSKAEEEAKAKAGPMTDACSTCPPPPKCKGLIEDMEHKNRSLNKELAKYDPASDAIGGHPYAGPGGITKYTKPGGHYKEIRDLQRGLKGDMESYNESKCYRNAPATDKITREAAQKNISKQIEIPKGMDFIPL